MKSYTPYENVRAADHPAILATSLNDTPRFLCRNRRSGSLLCDTSQPTPRNGRSCSRPKWWRATGASGRYKSWHELAFEYAWIIGR